MLYYNDKLIANKDFIINLEMNVVTELIRYHFIFNKLSSFFSKI